MRIVVPSINRAGKVLAMAGSFIVVPRQQAGLYMKYHEGVVAIDDNLDGSVAKKRNAILNLFPNEDLLMVDDDFLGVETIRGKERMGEEKFKRFAEVAFEMCRDLGAGAWGFNISNDPRRYVDYAPISLTKQFYGIVGVINQGIRYDERLNFAEDIDFWLSNLMKFRKTLRFNKYTPVFSSSKEGGIGERSKVKMEESYNILINKWGSRICHIKDLDNMVLAVNTPLKGI